MKVDDLTRRDAPIFLEIFGGIVRVFPNEIDRRGVVEELSRVFIGGDDDRLAAEFLDALREGRHDVVRFIADKTERWDGDSLEKFTGKVELEKEVVRRCGTIRLVLLENVATKRFGAHIVGAEKVIDWKGRHHG